MTRWRGKQSNPCYDIVKQRLPDRYFSALLASDVVRDALMAVYAFGGEVGSVSGRVSESALGEIGLQWWLDEIEALYAGRGGGHPVLSHLKPAIEHHDLPKHLFDNFIRAQVARLYGEPAETVGQLEKAFDSGDGVIFHLAGRVVDLDAALAIADLLDEAGRIVGYTGLLAGLSQDLQNGRCDIPLELFTAHKVSRKEVVGKPEKSRVLSLVQAELAHKARSGLALLRAEQNRISRDMLPVFWPASLCEPILNNLKRRHYDLKSRRGELGQLRRQWFLLGRSVFEKI